MITSKFSKYVFYKDRITTQISSSVPFNIKHEANICLFSFILFNSFDQIHFQIRNNSEILQFSKLVFTI